MTQLTIPQWIAYKTYFFNEDKSRTYISDERNHQYILLEGLASDLWQIIATKTSDEVKKWVDEKGLTNDFDGFIEELKEQGLLYKDNDKNSVESVPMQTEYSEELDKEGVKFVEDMQQWCSDNNLLPSLFVELTYACNLKCVHCYNPKHMSNVFTPFDKLKQIIDDASDLGCFKVIFSGGECTLHKDFLEIIKYVREKRMSVEIFTNGQTLYDNRELFKGIVDLYPCRVGLSLYSMNKETHEEVTQVEGSYEKTLWAIKELRKNNIYVQIKNFLLNINYKDNVEVRKFSLSIIASTAGDVSLIPTIEGDKKTFKYELNEEQLLELYTNPDSYLYVSPNFKSIRTGEQFKTTTPCKGGFCTLSISPTLDVYPCCSLPIKLGNINEISLKEIWQDAVNKKSDSPLCQWQNVRISDLKECYNEDYCQYCNYCAGMGMLENGYLKKSDVLCRQAKAKQKAFKINSESKRGCIAN